MRTPLSVLGMAILSLGCSPVDVNHPSGVEGVIMVGPVHGGPSRVGVSDSRALAKTDFVVKDGEKVVASFTTNDDGTFRVLLPPGHYNVVKKEAKTGIGRFGPFDLVVTAGEMTKVEWNCDTGMR